MANLWNPRIEIPNYAPAGSIEDLISPNFIGSFSAKGLHDTFVSLYFGSMVQYVKKSEVMVRPGK